MTFGFGLVGSGNMGLVYAEALATQVPDGHLVAVSGGSRAGALAADYGVPVEDTVEALLARPDVDAVILATPHTTHLPYTRLAAAAGKHVFCEKPMAVTVEECDAMLAACREAGVQLAVASQSRENPMLIEAKRLVDEGAIGEIRMVRMLSSTVGWDVGDLSWIEDPAEGGAFLDWGVHGMDALTWLTGSRATRVFATFASYGGRPIPDISAMVQYELASGAMVQVWMSYEFPPPGLGSNLQLLLVGEKAMLDVDRYSLKLGDAAGWTQVAEWAPWDWTTDPKNPRRIGTSARLVQDFAATVGAGGEHLHTAVKGRFNVEMVDYARRSAATHQAVDIPDPDSRV
jgi:predicted dehydrogenase